MLAMTYVWADTYVVNPNKINVRSQASTQSKVKYQLRKNDTINIVSYDDSRKWGKVSTDKGEGWVSLSLLTPVESQNNNTSDTKNWFSKQNLCRWAFWLALLFSIIGLAEIILLAKQAWARDRFWALFFQVGLPTLACWVIWTANIGVDLSSHFNYKLLSVLLPSLIAVLIAYPFLFTDWGKSTVDYIINIGIGGLLFWGSVIVVFVAPNYHTGIDYAFDIIVKLILFVGPNFLAYVILVGISTESICKQCGVYCKQELISSKTLAEHKQTVKTYSKELDYRTAEIVGDQILVTEYYKDRVTTNVNRYKLIESTHMCTCCGHIGSEKAWVKC